MRFEWKQSAGLSGILAVLALTFGSGCPRIDDLDDVIEEIADLLDQEIEIYQQRDPRQIALPDALVTSGDTVIINNNVNVITDVRQDIVVDVLPDIVLVGFENLTGLDGYYTYFVEDELQSIFVFDGETLLLEYPCLTDIELIAEEYFDPVSGTFIEGFDIDDGLFLNPEDFTCGEALIFTFDVDGIFSELTPIDLVR